jgi:5'-3' exonuclease
MVMGFLNQIIKLMTHNVIPLYVFDGNAPNEKDYVRECRQRKKNNIESKINKLCSEILLIDTKAALCHNNMEHITKTNEKIRLEKSLINIKKKDVDLIKKLFEIMNIPYLYAVGEADSLCAELYKKGKITACLSDDTDMLVLGCGRTIKFKNGKIHEFNLQHILKELQITHLQFIEMSILFGCDYLKIHINIDYRECYQLIKKYGSIKNILDVSGHEIFNTKNDRCKQFIKKYQHVTELFLNLSSCESVLDSYHFSITQIIDAENLLIFLNANTSTFDISQIIYCVEHINNNILNGHLLNF